MSTEQVDRKWVEAIVETVTREVLLAVAEEKATKETGVSCTEECYDGYCVQTCMDDVGQVVKAGASRVSSALGAVPADQSIASKIDHTLLKADATPDQIAQLCFEARKYGFASVCLNPTHVKLAAQLLENSDVKTCTVIGFPLGATLPEVKAFEALDAIKDGATEIDMVINIGALKSGDYTTVAQDIRGVVQVCHERNALVKVILEMALLTEEEKIAGCLIAKEAGADFVKTSTGFGPGGATVEDVALMRRVVGPQMGVKAAGGIHNYEEAQGMVQAGATRIGASAGVRIVREARGEVEAEGTGASGY
ncbi:MAG: deoxyribose-phosphate aldolase [Anaerolineales bacterium]